MGNKKSKANHHLTVGFVVRYKNQYSYYFLNKSPDGAWFRESHSADKGNEAGEEAGQPVMARMYSQKKR